MRSDDRSNNTQTVGLLRDEIDRQRIEREIDLPMDEHPNDLSGLEVRLLAHRLAVDEIPGLVRQPDHNRVMTLLQELQIPTVERDHCRLESGVLPGSLPKIL